MTQRCALGGSCSCCHGCCISTTSLRSPSANSSPSFSFLFNSSPSCHPEQPTPPFDVPFGLDPCEGNYYSSPVDCTLSLGTPSTRSSSRYEFERRLATGSCMPNFCWDLSQPPKQYSSSAANSNGSGSINGCSSGNDNLIARKCANCNTTSTPLWRNGPRGPKSLCNACGIRFKKEERRAAATSAGSGASGRPPSTAPHAFNSPSSWIHTHATTQPHKMAPSCFSTAAISNEFQFADDDGGDGQDSEVSFLSWHVNVADRPGLVHDFIR